SPCCASARHWSILVMLTFGDGTVDPNRNNAMIPSVKKIFLRSSGVLNAFAKAESIRPHFHLQMRLVQLPAEATNAAYQGLTPHPNQRPLLVGGGMGSGRHPGASATSFTALFGQAGGL